MKVGTKQSNIPHTTNWTQSVLTLLVSKERMQKIRAHKESHSVFILY